MVEANRAARVLVVDDDPRNRRVLAAMLGAEGCDVAEAEGGERALELASRDPPDLVLLDVMMPGLDGYEVASRLKAAPATHGVPIVIVTALDDRDSRLRGLAAGAADFVTKPVDRAELGIRVRNLLQLKRFGDALARQNRLLDQARADAEQANRAKSAFLATMSHEIRTPMNGVIAMAEILAHGRLDATQVELVDTIRRSAAALLRIIDDILDFSKIEAGRMELDLAPVRLHDLVADIVRSLAPVAARGGVTLDVAVAPQVPARVLADEGRLRQVLNNLVGNAVKFSGGRPQRPGRVAVRAHPAGGRPPCVALAIEDNGIGIAPEVLDTLFTPFAQADAATTRRYGGTGLGLAICKRLVELMRGEIAVASRPGEGSTFTVTLPLEAVDEAHDAAPGSHAMASFPVTGKVERRTAPDVATARREGRLILVAEDDAVNQSVILRQLGLLGYAAEVAEDGAQALRMWHAGRYGLVLTDLAMPTMDGYALAQAIRRAEAGRTRVPILALTANASREEAAHARAAGLDDCLTKPVPLALLRGVLERWLPPHAMPAVDDPA